MLLCDKRMNNMAKSYVVEMSMDIKSGNMTFKSNIPAALTFDEALLFSKWISCEMQKSLNRFFFERKPKDESEEEIPFN